MYEVKTRNWNCKRWVADALKVMCRLGVKFSDADDNDHKFYLETYNPVKAWAVWLYFMLLRPFSGGWTYIIRPGKSLIGETYKSIY